MSDFEFDTLFGSGRMKSDPPMSWPWPPPASPTKCPVCEGRTHMPRRFYEPDVDRYTNLAPATVPCRSCSGTGIIR